MKSKRKPQMDDLVQSIGEIAKTRDQLAYQAEKQYALEVEDILRTQSCDPRQIDRLLDGMLDFCFDPAMLRLYKKLCRYYFEIDPEAAASYVYAYREMWDEEWEANKDER
jgi:hypothetical protein